MNKETDGGEDTGGAGGTPTFLAPGNNRRMQERRAPERELFGDEWKEKFLDLLSTNCNVEASCAAAEVAVSTVYRHRRIDARFRDGWWRALEQGAAKLVALRFQRELERAEGNGDPLSALGTNGERRLDPAMDGPPDARQIADLYKLIGLLREHARGLGGEGRALRRAQDRPFGVLRTCFFFVWKRKRMNEGADGAGQAGSVPTQDDPSIRRLPGSGSGAGWLGGYSG